MPMKAMLQWACHWRIANKVLLCLTCQESCSMPLFQKLLGYLLAVVFVPFAIAAMWFAWRGLEVGWNWQGALGALLLSVLLRVNLFAPAGTYLYATRLWDLPQIDAILFALPTLLILTPGIAREVLRSNTRMDDLA
jgi:uncharacterized membrane protein YozB (DUF420 family)